GPRPGCRAGACPPPYWAAWWSGSHSPGSPDSSRALRSRPFELHGGPVSMAAPPRRRKRIRLDPAAYAEVGHVCSITIAVRDRRPVFADPVVAACAVDVLRGHADRSAVRIFAFCVMPDHVHVVAEP